MPVTRTPHVSSFTHGLRSAAGMGTVRGRHDKPVVRPGEELTGVRERRGGCSDANSSKPCCHALKGPDYAPEVRCASARRSPDGSADRPKLPAGPSRVL